MTRLVHDRGPRARDTGEIGLDESVDRLADRLRSTGADASWRLAGVAVASGLLVGSAFLGLRGTAALWAVWLVVLVVRRGSRISGVFFTCISAYGTVAWLAAAFGDRYFPPFPSLAVIETATLTDLRAVVSAYVAVEAVLGSARVGDAVRDAAERSRRALSWSYRVPTLRGVVLLWLLLVGVLDWVTVLRIGIGSILAGARRAYANELLLGAEHNVQLITVALSIVAGVWAVWSPYRVAPLLGLAVCWSPFVLVGSRKELLLVAAALGVVIASGRAHRVLVVCGAVVAFLFVQPALKSGDVFDSLHEVILPQYMHFALVLNFVPPDFGGPFLERAQFLLPGPLRLTEPIDLSKAFFSSGTAGVGVGSSPFAEASIIDPAIPTECSFAALVLGLVVLMVVAARRVYFVALLAYAQLITFGRSDTWIALFFIVYIGLLLHVLVRLSGRAVSRRAPGTGAS